MKKLLIGLVLVVIIMLVAVTGGSYYMLSFSLAPDTAIFGSKAPRLPNTSAFATFGIKAETALIMLDLAGVALSSGSACSSGKVRRSHVLTAMGVDPVMSEGALRASLGWTTCEADIDQFVAAYAKALAANPNRKVQAAA